MPLFCITCWFCTDILAKEETGEYKEEAKEVMNLPDPGIIWRDVASA